LLKVEGLTRRFGDRVAVDGVALEVGQGEVFGLLGPNGAGKSTTFQILAGLLRPDAGQLTFRGQPVAFDSAAMRAQMGVVFQKNSLDDQLTAEENLMLGARLYAVPANLARERMRELLALFELGDRAGERVVGWSGGMRRRLELARALIHRPALLLLDEPTQGLDDVSFQKLWAHLRALRQSHDLTVLLTTHRPEEAEGCDRLAVLDAGKRVACETPAVLASKVGGDVITIEATEPEEVAAALCSRLGLDAQVVDGRIRVERSEGHGWIPRIVESLPHGRLTSISLRRPTLADVFLKLTGHVLQTPPVEAPQKKGKRR
jgi:ABC-2 type transport system ATP-binding protein